MNTKFSKFFEVKIQYQKMLENGKEKKVTEQYVVESLSFTEAEARIIKEMPHYTSGEFDVVSEKIASYFEIILSDKSDDDKWFISKVSFITLDEKTAKEKKTSQRFLVQADTSQTALEYTKKLFDRSMTDYTIDAVQETQTIEVFFNSLENPFDIQKQVDNADNIF